MCAYVAYGVHTSISMILELLIPIPPLKFKLYTANKCPRNSRHYFSLDPALKKKLMDGGSRF